MDNEQEGVPEVPDSSQDVDSEVDLDEDRNSDGSELRSEFDSENSQNYPDHDYFVYQDDSELDSQDLYYLEGSMSYDEDEVVVLGSETDEDEEVILEEEEGEGGENSSDSDDDDEGVQEVGARGEELANESEVQRQVMESAMRAAISRAMVLHPQFGGGFLPPGLDVSPPADVISNPNRETGAVVVAAGSSRTRPAEVEDAEEPKSPPEKKARLDSGPENVFSSSQNDGDGCLICSENFASCGTHMLCCLKCGHMFGKSCIEKWLVVGKHKTCPVCVSKASKKDIRVLYTTQRVAVTDTSELEDLRSKLKTGEVERSKIQLENAILRTKLESSQMEISRLKTNIATLNDVSTKTATANTQVIPAVVHSEPVPSTSRGIPGRKSCRFQLCKQFEIREGACRVGTFNEELNMLVVSHEIKNSLYPAGCGAIKQFNLLDMRPSVSLPIHQKQIRDMAFSLCQTNILLTVSLDKKAVLFNCSGNVPVQTFQTECPLWSCCWDEVNQFIFYVGTHNGQIISFDIRAPSEPVATFSVPSGDSSPVCRLKYVSPAYQSNSFRMTGLIIQKLNSVWFCELTGSGQRQEQKFHQLPLEGPFVNVDFEPVSRHILVSTRPSSRTQSNNCTHYVCNLVQVYSDAVEGNVVSANIIRTYQGGSRGAQKMCRSVIFSPDQGYVYACANGSMNNAVKMWDISLSESDCKLIAPVPDVIVDFVRGRVNHKHFMSLISEKGVSIFEENFE